MRRLVEAVRREFVLAPVGAILLAVVMTWPTMASPATTIPQDLGDPLLVAWAVAWGGHALLHQPTRLFQANTFYPEPDSYAFSDTTFGYFPFALFGSGPEAAVIRYNLIYVFVAALAFFGAYALARQLGAHWVGAVVTGAAFAYAPWRLAQAGHLHVISTGGVALAVAALLRGHGYSFTRGYRADLVRPGWAAVGWAVACWQVLIGFGVGLPFAYVLALIGICAAIGWLVTGRPRLPRRLVAADVVGGVAFAATGLLMAMPYLRVVEAHPYARRSVADVELFSPPLRGFFTAPAESWLWGEAHVEARETLTWAPEMTLLPGVVLIMLAVLGAMLGSWSVRQRVTLGLVTVVSIVLAMGTEFFDGEYGYLLLYEYLPGFDAIRTPGRLVIFTTLALGLLAAGAVTAFLRSMTTPEGARHGDPRSSDELPANPGHAVDDAASEPNAGEPNAGEHPADEQLAGEHPAGVQAAGERPTDSLSARAGGGARVRWAAGAAALVPAALVLFEGLNVTPHPEVPRQPAALRGVQGPVLVLPTSPASDYAMMFWSTDGFPKLVNGSSGLIPMSQHETRTIAASFPDAASVDHLRRIGVRTVVLLTDWTPNSPWADAATRPTAGLPLRRSYVDRTIVFHLDPLR